MFPKQIILIILLIWSLPSFYFRGKFRKIVYQTDDWKINIKPFFIKELKGFKKIFLKSGESKKVVFKISSDDLKFHNSKELIVEPGEFEIAISASSNFNFEKSFELR